MADQIPLYFKDEFSPDTENRSNPPEGSFPEITRIPHNYGRNTVDSVLKIDLQHEKEPFIVTGYTSLLRVVRLIAGLKEDQDLRLLIGNEPFPITNAPMSLALVTFPEEVQKYWLNKRISLLQYPDVFVALEKMRLGQVDAAYLDIPGRMMHAKMVITSEVAMLGSSNFSNSGLTRNIEANARFKKDEEEQRYTEISEYAEALFSLADDYRGHLKDLLESLLQASSWKDCIARACSELLEGHWAKKYTSYTTLSNPDLALWPSQQQGIAQALWIIENLGSVLVADATGSGKTRMGTALQRAVFDRLIRTGNIRGGGMSLISPPGVVSGWQKELLSYGLSHQPLSQAALSFVDKERAINSFVEQCIKQGQILTVDEAHNYLNAGSKRAQVLLRNLADHVMLFTATPINRSASDLLCLVNILGADNFDPKVIQQFNNWLRLDVKKMREAREDQLESLKSEIAKFTVRRTKRELNNLVDKDPDSYLNKHQQLCRYPEHKAIPYDTGESDASISIAHKIRELTNQLKGVAFITRTIDESAFSTPDGESLDPESVFKRRLGMAKRSAAYQVISHLRSSRASAYAHIAGLQQTLAFFKFGAKDSTGHKGMIPKLSELEEAPGVVLPEQLIGQIEIPDWLNDQVAFERARDKEINIYQDILSELETLDDSRELAKLMLIRELFTNQDQLGVIAFDRHPLTLIYLRHLSEKHQILDDVILLRASGDSTKTERKEVDRYLNNENPLTENVLALCSDAMSEGYNLQNASAVVHLDMPSVVRLVEQRIGRVDRMDSIHDEIHVYWPRDHEAFALRADDRLIERFEANEMLLGSNFYLPEGMSDHCVNYEEIIEQAEKESVSWDGIQDAFDPVRSLIGDESGLVSTEHYQEMAAIEETCTRISAVASDHDWGFFCISGTEFGSPKWVLLSSKQKEPITDLSHISTFLSGQLNDDTKEIDLHSDRCFADVKSYLGRLPEIERNLLPRRKQVALSEMELILGKWAQHADEEQTLFYKKLMGILSQKIETQRAVNWSLLADRWLELIRPVWYEKLNSARGRKAILLSDLRDVLISSPLPFERVYEHFVVMPDPTTHVSERIAACIIGVKK
ncbi:MULTISPECIES: SNF2-related protein [unclassified Neptuniibacter]|uniref:SNF2-related protein n=1 Tax=unclassified Neptuniibacter TaxID=2630693 RepID=UPI0025F45E25|nr:MULTISPECIES: SNF2-related protein [unclassified Neptuniibacter]|tara:strand:+ start:3619 stop:6903 length:3285 start_codon:yes stop_codon:yes gene_type:complete